MYHNSISWIIMSVSRVTNGKFSGQSIMDVKHVESMDDVVFLPSLDDGPAAALGRHVAVHGEGVREEPVHPAPLWIHLH